MVWFCFSLCELRAVLICCFSASMCVAELEAWAITVYNLMIFYRNYVKFKLAVLNALKHSLLLLAPVTDQIVQIKILIC